MITSTGIPTTSALKKSVKAGTLTICVRRLEMISASPRALASMASVAMKGTTLPYAMSSPLTRPQPAPTASAAKTMTSQLAEFAIAWVASVVHHTELRARMAPTDRSMPPPVITKVMPDADHADHRGQPQDGQHVVRVGEPVAGRHHADDAEQQQGNHQAEVAARRGPQQLGDPPARVGPAAGGRARCRAPPAGPGRSPHRRVRTRCCSGRSCGRSFHHQVEHSRLVESRRRDPRGRRSLRASPAPGRRGRAPPRPRWRPPRRPPPSRPASGSARRSRSGRPRRPHASARRAAGPGTRAAASAPAGPSAGCRPRACGRRARRRSGARPGRRSSFSAAARSAALSRKPARAKRRREDTVMLR